MPSLARLTGLPEIGLAKFPDTPSACLSRRIDAVWPLRPGDCTPKRGILAQSLAVADLQEWADASLHQLAHRAAAVGVAALAVATDNGDVPPALVGALMALRVPLLTVPTETSWVDVAEAVRRERAEDQRLAVGWRDWLASQLRQAQDGRQVARIVRWLATQAGIRVALIGSDSSLLAAAPQLAARALPALADTIQQIASGALQSAAFEENGTRKRLLAVGGGQTRAVLVLARDSPFDRTANQIINRTVDLLALHLLVEDVKARQDSHHAAGAALRAAILQLLMAGEADVAGKVAASLYPAGQFQHPVARLYVLEGRPDDRDDLLKECQRRVGALALVNPCTDFAEHVLVVAPQPCATHEEDGGVAEALHALVAEQPRRYLGKSDIRPIAETNQMYRHALRSLTSARLDRSRTAVYDQRGRLPELLNYLRPGWSRVVLGPLLAEPAPERDLLLQALNLALHTSVREAAELIGAHRNTVASRVRAAASILDLDLDSIRHRAVAAVALEAFGLEGPRDDLEPVEVVEDLRDYLVGSEAQAWQSDLLSPLPADLAESVKEWVLADGDTARMAAALGVHQQTARKRLRGATLHVQRDLLGHTADVYDVVLAVASHFALPVPLRRG
ncbi:helix-turn-helix domain-containing protein [Kitasatospora sp. NA04385]|uniref:helix-turn-helix domain-containing protein n=1 Tax=Kitasatospora sp. NA04385 TaxID=2742135 RepID=UPI00159041A9|nr:helix-turn-helix domain-containing protein [Kitasatospora sp. NA04385]QKW22259.1 helix-turn-helix domain-containing protein [Kitasatospora sp. NA04385]